MAAAGRPRPVRRCVGCRRSGPKHELLRFRRDAARNVVDVDPSGAAPGRGAYVHRDRACVERALRGGALARALRGGLRPDELGRLRERIEGELGSA